MSININYTDEERQGDGSVVLTKAAGSGKLLTKGTRMGKVRFTLVHGRSNMKSIGSPIAVASIKF